MKTFSYTIGRVGSSDMSQEMQEARAAGIPVDSYQITIYDAAGITPAAEAIYFPTEGRLGIAWGADATWADVKDVERGIEMWLNDGDA